MSKLFFGECVETKKMSEYMEAKENVFPHGTDLYEQFKQCNVMHEKSGANCLY